MLTTEIPRDQWVRFFDGFSKDREGWIVTVEIVDSDLGDQNETTGLPLVGISADAKDGENRVELIIGDSPDAHVTRIIESPRRVWLKNDDLPGHEAIEVEGGDGSMTLLHFHHIDQPERQLPAGEERKTDPAVAKK